MPGFDEPRAFSIATSPIEESKIELNISLVPDGEVTPLIHKDVKVGDSFKIAGPFGRFFVKESAKTYDIFCRWFRVIKS